MGESEDIYGEYREKLNIIMEDMTGRIAAYSDEYEREHGEKLYEHYSCRIKSDSSMREKCDRMELPQNAHSALTKIKDSIGIRIVCLFIDDIYKNLERIRAFSGCTVFREKDYIQHAKPNGYRSYHIILLVDTPFADAKGRAPGRYFVEIQLRTIAMDTWAALEHELRYKKQIAEAELIAEELKRCANELAACDVSMQTIRNLIRSDGN